MRTADCTAQVGRREYSSTAALERWRIWMGRASRFKGMDLDGGLQAVDGGSGGRESSEGSVGAANPCATTGASYGLRKADCRLRHRSVRRRCAMTTGLRPRRHRTECQETERSRKNRRNWRTSSARSIRRTPVLRQLFRRKGWSRALGAVYEGVNHLPRAHGKLIPDYLERLFRRLDEVTKPCPMGSQVSVCRSRWMIVHLNDDHRITREQIAEWLTQESTGLTLIPKSAEPDARCHRLIRHVRAREHPIKQGFHVFPRSLQAKPVTATPTRPSGSPAWRSCQTTPRVGASSPNLRPLTRMYGCGARRHRENRRHRLFLPGWRG